MKNNNYFTKEFECPHCGHIMDRVDSLVDLECPNCGVQASIEYDDVNKEYYADASDYDEIYDQPSDEMPPYCKICGGPYPRCCTSCKFFDF